jgi:enoyl-CoA hydratase/carnithine racemase
MAAGATLYEVGNGVAVLRMEYPETRNAFDRTLARDLAAALDRAVEDADVRVVVLTGSGRFFCPGMGLSTGEDPEPAGLASASSVFEKLTALPKPVIAAVNGGCAGIGFALALSCDIRFAADTVRISAAWPRRGFVAEEGASWLLPRLVGMAAALDLLLSGRTFAADEAARLGLVARVVAPEALLDEVLDYARDIAANCSPRALAGIKQQVYADVTGSYPTSLAVSRRQIAAADPDDVREGIAGFVERRLPQFAPLAPQGQPPVFQPAGAPVPARTAVERSA